MEDNTTDSARDSEPVSPSNKTQGGFRASMYIFVFSGMESMGFIANMSSLFLYLGLVMHFDLPGAANTLTNFLGSTFMLSLIGGLLSDTYLSRLNTCLIFGLVEVVALAMFTIQAGSHVLQPEACADSSCQLEGGKAVYFYTSMGLLALGSGAVRGALPAFGGDQFNQKDPKEAKALASYFNWLLLSITMGAILGVTVIVWISMNRGWHWGFMIYTLTTFIGLAFLAAGKPFYRCRAPGDSPMIRIAQVIAAAFHSRSLSLPEDPCELYEVDYNEKESHEEKIYHTNQFRCLDKAAIFREDSGTDPWRVCTVTQVEEVKILTRMLPILASTVIMNTCLAQLQTFSVQQGSAMNLYLGSFKVPPASVPVIPLVFMSILIPIYEFVFVPFARKITGHPSGITQLQRVGIGLVLSAVSMTIAGFVEVKRRNQDIRDPSKPISLFWLSFQYGVFGIADMFTLIGLLEFFYKEAPSGMRSMSTSFTGLSLSLGYFLSSVLVDIINSISKRVSPSRQGWLHGKFLDDSDKLYLFYWFLALLSCLNFANYLFWASWYKYKEDSPDPKIKSKSTDGSFSQEHRKTVGDDVANKNGVSSADNTEDRK